MISVIGNILIARETFCNEQTVNKKVYYKKQKISFGFLNYYTICGIMKIMNIYF